VHPILEQLGISQREIMLLNPAEQEDLLRLVDEYDNKIEIEKCRTSFSAFARRMWKVIDGSDFVEGKHHKRLAEVLDQVAEGKLKRVAISLPPRHSLALDTEVLTTKGWRTIGTLAVGDYVYGANGKPVRVEGKSPVYYGTPCYKVTTDDGAEVVCDGDHLWAVTLRDLAQPRVVRSTESLIAWIEQKGRAPKIELHEPLQMPEAELPLDPYLLGLWLGDGTAGESELTLNADHSEHIIGRLKSRGTEYYKQEAYLRWGARGVATILRTMNLRRNKHIPEAYLLASYEQRLELLRGLMDTDGNVMKAGQSFYNTSDPQLCEQVCQLLSSLGIKPMVARCAAKFEGREYGTYYRISFYKTGTCTLPQRAERQRDYAKPVGRYVAIAPAKSVPVQCIKIANDDGLFLVTRRFLVTHNTKSMYASKLFPAYFIGRNASRFIMQSCNVKGLADQFGAAVRAIIMSEEYQEIFPETKLDPSSTAKGDWATTKSGKYYAVGVGGTMAGRGADLSVIDDPHDEREAVIGLVRPEIYDVTYDWYKSGPRQRLQPNGAILVIQTRWSKRDLIGRILADDKDGEWTVVEMPAILPSGNPLWPEYWSLEELNKVKENIGMMRWNAQYMQQPTSVEQAMVKPSDWIPWTEPGETKPPPRCSFIVQSWDTAHSAKKHANPSACTTWGVTEVENRPALVLLHAWQDRVEFPELKLRAKELYKEWKPDYVIIESQASGRPLMAEMRVAGVPVVEFKAQSGVDKITRVNAVTDLFKAGFVRYVPSSDTNQVISQLAEFPAGSADDLVDSTTAALDLLKRQINDYRRKEATEDDDEDTELVRTRLRRKFY
jgi:predicted phage terminase large subunit-like protein